MTELDERASELSGNNNPTPADAGPDAPRKRGRPKGSKNKPKDGTQPISQVETEETPRDWRNFVYTPDANSVQASAAMCRVTWYLLSLMLPIRELNDAEAKQIGEAADPVFCRWLPVFGNFKYEMAFLMCILTLYFQTRIEPEKPAPRDITDESHVSTAGQ
jgi:hypothetical protein